MLSVLSRLNQMIWLIIIRKELVDEPVQKSHLLFFVASAIITVTLSAPSALYCMEPFEEKKECQEQNKSVSESISPAGEFFILGAIYFHENNFSKCIDYFEKSAEQGSVEASYNLGVIYEYGVSDEYPSDLNKALHWYVLAYKKDYAKAKIALDRVLEKNKSWSEWLSNLFLKK